MRILIYGTGAVGGYYGLKLLDKGNDVTFLSRNKTYQKIKKNGLILDSYTTGVKEFKNIKLLDFNDIENVMEKYDLILFCVKSYDTENNIKHLKKLLSETGKIISLQNGVENEIILSNHFSQNQIFGAVVFIASELKNYNLVKHTGAGKLIFGSLNKENDGYGKYLNELFISSGIESEFTDNINKKLWEKLVWNASFNSVSVVLKAVVMDMIKCSESYELLKDTMLEVIDTAASLGIHIDKEIVEKHLSVDANIGEFKTSMLQDFEKGKKLEFEFFNGSVIRIAEKNNVSVPVNRFLYKVLKFIEWKNN